MIEPEFLPTSAPVAVCPVTFTSSSVTLRITLPGPVAPNSPTLSRLLLLMKRFWTVKPGAPPSNVAVNAPDMPPIGSQPVTLSPAVRRSRFAVNL